MPNATSSRVLVSRRFKPAINGGPTGLRSPTLPVTGVRADHYTIGPVSTPSTTGPYLTNMDGNDLVTVSDLVLLAETDKAYGVAVVEGEAEKKNVEYWLPKSQVDRITMKKGGDTGEVDIPRWLAEKNNLEYED